MNRKLKYLYASKEFVAALLKTGKKTVTKGVPYDATVMHIVYRPEYDVFHIIIHSETFRKLAECELIPEMKDINVKGECKQ